MSAQEPMGAPELGRTLEDVAAVIGRDLAPILVASAKPCGRRGRRFVFIPKRPRPGHPVALAVGMDAARALAAAFPSITLEVGHAAPVVRAWRRARAVQLIEAGADLRTAAAGAGVHARTGRTAWREWDGAPCIVNRRRS